MPPPIVPAPMIATSRISARRRVLRDVWHLGHGALGEERMHQRPALVGAHAASEEELALAAAAFLERQRGRGLDRLDGGERRGLVRRRLARQLRPAASSGAAVAGVPSLSVRSRVRGCGPPLAAASRANATAPSRRSPSMRRSMSPRPVPRAPVISLSRDAHVDGLLDADEPGQPLRAFGARDDAEIDFRLTHPRVAKRDAVVAGHRQLEPAAERRAVNRHHHRLGGVFDAREQVMNVGSARRRGSHAACSRSAMSAPATNVRPAPMTTMARTARIGAGLVERRESAPRHARAQRVDRRVVDDDKGDRVLGFESNGHGLVIVVRPR